jgi:tetratricopeptide (TPR) repeat protein
MSRRILVLLAFLLALLAVPSPAKREPWVEARSPNFIVASNAGDKDARKAAVQFEQIRTLFRASLKVASQHQTPVVTILAVKDEKSLSELMPEYWTKGSSHPAGLFTAAVNQFFMAVDLTAPGSNPYQTIYHEYYHSLTSPYFPTLPLWLTEGLADFYGNTEITDKEAGIGRPDPDLISELRNTKLISVDVLFHVDAGSPYYNEQNKTSIFYAESWALTHYLMIGDDRAHRQSLINFLQALNEGATTDEAAAKSFGDLKQLQKALEHYVHNSKFYYMKAAVPQKIPESDIHTRPLSEAEADAYIGGFAVVRSQYGQAQRLLDDAVRLDPNLPLAYQYLSLLQYFKGEREPSLASASKGIALDPKNALTRYLRAYLATAGTRLTTVDSQIEQDLRVAIAASPEFPPPYALLGIVLAANGSNLSEALSMAQKAVSFEPGNSSYRLDLAQIYLRMGRYDEALKEGQFASLGAKEPEERARAAHFLNAVNQIRNLQARQSSGPAAGAESEPKTAIAEGEPSKPVEPTGTSEPSAPSDMKEFTGLVTQLSCMGRLEIEVKSESGSMHIHSVPNLRPQIRMQRPVSGYDLCKSLKGERVSVQFKPDDKKGKNGTIYALMILSPEGPQKSAPAQGQAPGQVLRVPSSPASPGEDSNVATTMSGTVDEVTCNGNELQLALNVRDVEFALHARDFTHITLDRETPSESGQFSVCKDLAGRHAKITFILVEHKPYDGEIQSIEIEE